MKSKAIIIGKFYRLRSNPDYSYIKPIKILPARSRENKNPFVIVICEHTVYKEDTIGFMRKFRLHEIGAEAL